MISIPGDKNIDTILRCAHENELFNISLCHGPGGFLSTILDYRESLYKRLASNELGKLAATELYPQIVKTDFKG